MKKIETLKKEISYVKDEDRNTYSWKLEFID